MGLTHFSRKMHLVTVPMKIRNLQNKVRLQKILMQVIHHLWSLLLYLYQFLALLRLLHSLRSQRLKYHLHLRRKRNPIDLQACLRLGSPALPPLEHPPKYQSHCLILVLLQPAMLLLGSGLDDLVRGQHEVHPWQMQFCQDMMRMMRIK